MWCARESKTTQKRQAATTRAVAKGLTFVAVDKDKYSSEMDFRRPSVARPIDCHSPTSCRQDQLVARACSALTREHRDVKEWAKILEIFSQLKNVCETLTFTTRSETDD